MKKSICAFLLLIMFVASGWKIVEDFGHLSIKIDTSLDGDGQYSSDESDFSYKEPNIVLSGWVIDTNNTLIEDVEVKAFRYTYQGYGLPDIKRIGEIYSKDGMFEFEYPREVERDVKPEEYHYPDSIVFIAQKDGYSFGWNEVDVYENDCNIVLGRPYEFIGQVLNTKEESVEGAEVRLVIGKDNRFNNPLYGLEPIDSFKTLTDSKGFFKFNRLNFGEYLHFIVEADGYCKLITSDGETSNLDYDYIIPKVGQIGAAYSLKLLNCCTIEGRVLDKNGDPVENVNLRVVRMGEASEADKNIFYINSDSNGKFKLSGIHGGHYRIDTPIEVNQWLCNKVAFYINPEETVCGDIEVSMKSKLEVLVTGIQDGQLSQDDILCAIPLDGYKKYGKQRGNGRTLYPIDYLAHKSQLDDKGNAIFHLPEGEYELFVLFRDDIAGKEIVSIREGTDTFFEFNIEQIRPTVISVFDPNGKSAAEVGLHHFGKNTRHLMLTNSNGIAEFTGDFFGNDTNDFIIARDASQNLVGITQIKKNQKEFTINLKQGLQISGRVVNEKGEPIADCKVKANIIRKFLYYDNLRKYEQESTLDLENAVLYGDNFEVKEDYLTYVNYLTEANDYLTDANGYFVVGALLDKYDYEFSVGSDGYRSVKKRITINGNSVNLEDIVLIDSNLIITGCVVDADESPVRGVYVTSAKYGSHGGETDENGVFTITNLTEGQVTIEMNDETGEFRSDEFKCNAGDKDVKYVVERKINAELKILVIEDETGKPIKGTKIAIVPSKIIVSEEFKETDENGLIHFRCPWKDKYEFKIIHNNCYWSSSNFTPNYIEISEDKDYSLEIRFKKH